MKILKSILNYIPLATFIIFVVLRAPARALLQSVSS